MAGWRCGLLYHTKPLSVLSKTIK